MNTRISHSLVFALSLVILIAVIFVFGPFTTNYFLFPKLILLAASVLLSLLIFFAPALSAHPFPLVKSRLAFPLFLFNVVLVANLVLNSEGRTEAIFGKITMFVALSILALLLSSLPRSTKTISTLLTTLLASTTILALHSLLQLTVLYSATFLPTYMQTKSFTPTGSPLTTAALLALGLFLSLSLLRHLPHRVSYYLTLATSFLHTVALVALVAMMLPGQALAPILLPYSASWSVTLDALKTLRSLTFGVGFANFPTFFTQTKPLFLNTTSLWNTLPQTATSELLQFLATTGILGLATFLLLPFSFLRYHSDSPTTTILLRLMWATLFLFIFLPGSLPLFTLFFILLGLLGSTDQTWEISSRPVRLTLVTLALIFVGASVYFLSLFVRAELSLQKAQLALQNNDAKTLYEQSLKAVTLLPTMTNYRLSYSRVNLSIATAISQNPSLSDEQKTQISQLLSQAIREAKAATSLTPQSSLAWQNLGSLYRNLINVAQGSDQFAVSAYAQAVSLDPANPALRIEFGGLLYQLAQLTTDNTQKIQLLNRAVQEFSTAIQLKKDYANGYYNLAKAYELAENYQLAYNSLQTALTYLDPASADYAQVTQELEGLKAKLPVASASPTPSPSPTTTLATPSPLPPPLPGGPIELPTTN